MRLFPVLLAMGMSVTHLSYSYAQDAEGLLRKNGCLKCHSVSSEKDGPSFKATAAKYKGKPDAAPTLQSGLKSGKMGKEDKHATFKGSDAELKTVVDYILSR